jgi:hypothetical protein
MGNTSSILDKEFVSNNVCVDNKEFVINTVFDFKKSFYDVYKDPVYIQKMKESYEKQKY